MKYISYVIQKIEMNHREQIRLEWNASKSVEQVDYHNICSMILSYSEPDVRFVVYHEVDSCDRFFYTCENERDVYLLIGHRLYPIREELIVYGNGFKYGDDTWYISGMNESEIFELYNKLKNDFNF